MSEVTITLALKESGLSESIVLSTVSTSVSELHDYARALLELDSSTLLALYKDGHKLPPAMTLQQAGLEEGDIVVVEVLNDVLSMVTD